MRKSDSFKSRSVFERLEAHGIGADQYAHIKSLVSFDLPQSRLFFERQFPHRTPAQVLKQVELWRDLLKRDFILSDAVKEQVETSVLGAELFAWRAVTEAAFSRPQGMWSLSWRFLGTSRTGDAAFINPEIEVTAIHSETKERRAVVMPCHRGNAAWGAGWRAAFRQLGVLDEVLNHRGQKPTATRRGEQGWPIFTQFVIPRLYRFLRPYYRSRGHIWSEKETTLKRDAIFSKDLLQDMLDILKLEHPDAFKSTTLRQVKAAVQRYLEKKRKNTISPK